LESFYLIYSVLYLFYSDYNLAGFNIYNVKKNKIEQLYCQTTKTIYRDNFIAILFY